MRFPWLPEEYERTCAECGHTWQVPRWARRRQVKSLRMMSRLMVTSDIGESTDSSDLSRQVESISAQNEAIDAFRHCPECGAEHFTQHASRGSQPR